MKIADVSEQCGLSNDTLRYYERVGLIQPVNRNRSGIRDYNELDLRRVEFIKCMRSAGLPIEVLIEYVGLVEQGDSTIKARKEILKEQGRTQVWLAGKIGKSQGTIALYVNNKLQPTLDTLYRIAEFLEVNPKKLLANTAKSKKNNTSI